MPTGYYLERDPDVLIVRRLDGSMANAFSARGLDPKVVLGAIEENGPQVPSADRETAMPVSSALQAHFFGHFKMFCDDEALPLGRNGQALAILKYLLAHRARPVSRDRLMGWLWPKSNLKRARASLNSAIHDLRKRLSECPASVLKNYILLEEGYYRLNPSVQVATDVDEFDEHHEQGCRLEKSGRTEEATAEYEKALELYRADYLVEDLYEDWTMVERERLANAYVDMLGRLAVHYMESGQPQEAIRASYRLLEKDLCHEDSYRLLMRCYVCLGLRDRALRQYRLCEETLLRHYDMVPSPETQALFRSLLVVKST